MPQSKVLSKDAFLQDQSCWLVSNNVGNRPEGEKRVWGADRKMLERLCYLIHRAAEVESTQDYNLHLPRNTYYAVINTIPVVPSLILQHPAVS